MEREIIGANPLTGELIWHHAFTPHGSNIATPVWDGESRLFFSSAYDSGSRVIKLTHKDGETVPEQLWYSRKMRIHHGNAIRLGDTVYASSGDFGPAFLMAMNLETGKRVWIERGFGKSNFLYADGKLIILDEDGQLALATASPEGITIHAKCKIAERYAWAAPTLVGKTLYVRDRKHIMALDLG
jgi:outer membrane protein assembly factor BamB